MQSWKQSVAWHMIWQPGDAPENWQMNQETTAVPQSARSGWIAVAVSWTLVGIPLAWGIWKTLVKAAILFK